MTSKVRLSRTAHEDLLAIAARIAVDSPDSAETLVRAFDRSFALHAKHPLMAAIFPAHPRYRYFALGNYVAFYEPQDDGILVVRVLHGARNLAEILGLS